MENFPTPQRANLPWIANLATLVAVVTAIGWSGGQRPHLPTAAVSAAAPVSTKATPVANQVPAPQPAAAQGRWPTKATSRVLDGLQAVAYSPGQLR
jgi:hypothetical protein